MIAVKRKISESLKEIYFKECGVIKIILIFQIPEMFGDSSEMHGLRAKGGKKRGIAPPESDEDDEGMYSSSFFRF